MKRAGARMHPCLSPEVTSNASVSSRPIDTLAIIPSWKLLIMLTILDGMPIFRRRFHIRGLLTVSNALTRSTKIM